MGHIVVYAHQSAMAAGSGDEVVFKEVDVDREEDEDEVRVDLLICICISMKNVKIQLFGYKFSDCV